MLFKNSYIEAYGINLPPEYLTSEAIEVRLTPIYEKLHLPYGRLELQTGIRRRGFWRPGTNPSDIAIAAAEQALEKSNVKREEIEVLIHASVCRDFLEPATATVIHNKLGLNPKCTIFDLSNACLGVVNAFIAISNMIELGQIECGMVVSGENSGPLLFKTIDLLLNDESLTRKSIKKYFANLTIGSAGVAYILTNKNRSTSGHQLLGGSVMADTSASILCRGDGNSSDLMMETDSEALMHAGVKLAKANWIETKSVLNWTNSTPSKIIGHQVGVAHRSMMLSSLELDERNDFSTFEEFGNTGSAALPLSLAMAANDGFIKSGDVVALLGIGSGLNTVMLGAKW